MINFDFDTTVYKNNKKYLDKTKLINKLNTYNMIGWMSNVEVDINRIKNKVNEIKENSELLLVIGIGGSYLGSKSIYDMFNEYFNKKFEVIYVGNTLSSNYLNDLKELLKDKDFSVNVISKSGNTLEIKLTYKYIKNILKEKYNEEEIKKRIIITTGNSGYLYEEALKNNYFLFNIPDNIGGRYSMMSYAHLFPLAFNINIDEFIKGYNESDYIEESYVYAINRKMMFDTNKYIENYCVFEPKLYMFTEWLKQLFAESEGKNNKGIYPVSSIYTRDLHSLGQFIQDGHNIVFETFIVIKNNKDLLIDNKDLSQINNIIVDSVRIAHHKGNVSVNYIEIESLDEYTIGSLIKFFFYASSFSSILFGVNPFDQNGVEVYKNEIKKRIE